MVERLAFIGIAIVGSIVSLPRIPVYVYEVVAQAPVPTPVPPTVIPAWILGGGKFNSCCVDIDPGATPDQHLFAGVVDASASTAPNLGTNCPGIGSGGGNVSNCNPYKYVSMLILLCDGTLESSNAFNYLNSVAGSAGEAGFLHTWSHAKQTPMPTNRLAVSGSCTPGPSTSVGFPTNPENPTFHTWLTSNVWTTPASNFPAPYGIYEDHFSAFGGKCVPSYEYGELACNLGGNSGSPEPIDWETALGGFENNAETNCPTTCFAFTGNGLTPGDGNNTNACTNFESGHCYATPQAGVVDDMDALDNICSAADSGGNLRAIAAEEIVFLKGATAGSPMYADTQTIVYIINTTSHLVNYTSGGCENTVAVDIESSGGSFPGLSGYGPGTVADGIPIREEATALRFLVPNPQTLVPDRIQPFYFTIGGSANTNCLSSPVGCEIPYFFEETIVPQGPEITVRPFTYAGKSSVGDGCPPSPMPSDYGGAADLVATCLGSDPDGGAAVFLQEYKHLYINGMDYGPAAVLLNTASTTSATISSSWFCSTCTPLSSFHYRLALSGGELASVLYSGATGGSISLPCTAAAYCTGDGSVSGNTTSFSGTYTMGPHDGVILLGSN